MEVKDKEVLDKVISSYSIDVSSMEEENRILKDTVTGLKEELNRFQKTPLLVAEVRDIHGENCVVRLPNGNEFFVESSSQCKGMQPGDSVLVEQKNLTIVRKIDTRKRFNVENFVIIEKPSISWNEIGGLKKVEEEIKEVIELPLKNPELFRKVGIHPPKGILLYGPPGTGKTLLAKAVANSTNSAFIEIVGSELVQKFIGEGAKLVKEVFQMAREKAPSIVFIDEIDAIASQRIDIGTSGEREVQRTFMQLLAEIDGFKNLGNVKIIGCTNRKDILDPAITRPGRLDRMIYVPLPKKEGIAEIFRIHSKDMKINKKTKFDQIFKLMEGFSGAEIKAVATEAGYFAIRANRTEITEKDLKDAIIKVKQREEEEGRDYIGMFG